MDARDFDKEEYVGLRAESQFHQVNASAVFALNVTGLGIGVAASTAYSPITLPVVALLSSILWTRYVDHVLAIFRAAAYITCRLRPRLMRAFHDDEGVLGWEGFLRTGDRAVPEPSQPGLPRMYLDSRRGLDVATWAFRAPPPLLLAWFAYRLVTEPGPIVDRGVGVLLAATGVVVWVWAAHRARQIRRQVGAIDTMIGDEVARSAARTGPVADVEP